MLKQDNTQGYSDRQLEELNAEFEKRFDSGGDYLPEYDRREEAEKAFTDEVSHR